LGCIRVNNRHSRLCGNPVLGKKPINTRRLRLLAIAIILLNSGCTDSFPVSSYNTWQTDDGNRVLMITTNDPRVAYFTPDTLWHVNVKHDCKEDTILKTLPVYYPGLKINDIDVRQSIEENQPVYTITIRHLHTGSNSCVQPYRFRWLIDMILPYSVESKWLDLKNGLQ